MYLRPIHKRDLASRHPFDRLFESLFSDASSAECRSASPAKGFAPALDVSETEEDFRVHVELPGVAPADVSVSIHDDVLTVEGEKRSETEESSENYRRVERRHGKFLRRLQLPTAVDGAAVKATSKDGVLTIVLPKRADARPRTIDVSVDE